MEYLPDSTFIKKFGKLCWMQQDDDYLTSAWKADHYITLMDWKP